MLNIDKPLLDAMLTKMVQDIKAGCHDSETECIFAVDGVQVHLKVTVDESEFLDFKPRGLVAV
jgi:hypothetical protein